MKQKNHQQGRRRVRRSSSKHVNKHHVNGGGLLAVCDRSNAGEQWERAVRVPDGRSEAQTARVLADNVGPWSNLCGVRGGVSDGVRRVVPGYQRHGKRPRVRVGDAGWRVAEQMDQTPG